MENNTSIAGSHNVVIQGVNDSTITVNVNGDVQEIRNQLEDLKTLMQNAHSSVFRAGDKEYHIADINEDNFHIATSKRLFNSTLVKGLFEIIEKNDAIKGWLAGIATDKRDNWEVEPTYLRKAQSFLEENFLWVLAWQLRRLFAVGLSPQLLDQKIEAYIRICFSCYRTALQFTNYLLISTLWDAKKIAPELPTNIPELEAFFGVAGLTTSEHRKLLGTLVGLFEEHGLDFPVTELQLGKTGIFTDSDSAFNKAGEKLEALEEMDGKGKPYRLGHCHTAEHNLAEVLKALPFFTSHQLVTIKRVEYEAVRHTSPRYIKDFSILERKREAKDLHSILKIDDNPTFSYALFFRNNRSAVNLFPFVIDYNVLINEDDFQIYLFENRESLSGLEYYSINESAHKTLSFTGTDPYLIEVKSGEEKREVQKNFRVDLAIRQFEDAMNTLLGSGDRFKVKASGAGDFGNI